MTVLSGSVVAAGGAGAAGVGGGAGGASDEGAAGGNGGAGGAGTGAGGTGEGGRGGYGGTGGAGGTGGDGGAGGAVTIWNDAVTATAGTGAAPIGGGAGGTGAAGGNAGATGATGASARVAPGAPGAAGPAGNAGAPGTVSYLPDSRPAATLAVSAPAGLQLAGTPARITARGLADGESYTIRIGGTQVATGTAVGGLLERRVTLPTFARDSRAAVVVTGSEANRTGSTATWILIKKRLGISNKKHVFFKRRQIVRVTGLVGQERVSVRYRGKLLSPSSAHATDGVYRFVFRVGKLRGVKSMRATGQFTGRTVVTHFRVSRR